MAADRDESAREETAAGRAPTARVVAMARAARRWIRARRATIGLAAAAVLLLVLGAVGLWLSFTTARLGLRPPATLADALDAIDRGAYVEARQLVQELLAAGDLSATQLGGPAFVLGVVTFQETDEGWSPTKRAAFLAAARYLQEARDRGFPAGRRGQGLFLLGKSLYLAGRYADCRQPLREALAADWKPKQEIYGLLANACLRQAHPEPERALAENTHYLALPNLTAAERAEGQLERCRILFGLGRTAACQKALTKLRPEVQKRSDVILLNGRLLLRQARAARGRHEADRAEATYRRAMEVFHQAEAHDTLDRQATRTAMYLTGVCLTEMGTSFRKAAIDQLARTRKLYFDSPEGLAASLLEADLLRQAKRDQEAVAVYRLALSAAGDPATYDNRWVPLATFRARVVAAYEDLCQRGQFERAMELLDRFRPIFPKLKTLELVARTAHRWGVALDRDAAGLAESRAEPNRRRARQHFRKAGYVYQQLARAHLAARRYPEDLWNSAQNLLLGHDFKTARRILQKYLNEKSRRSRAQALVDLGKANLALGDIDQAIETLQESIDYHARDAAVFSARLWCSKAYVEKGDYGRAEALLKKNLTSDFLTPKSNEWRDSLFALGRLLLMEGHYAKAIVRLEEAVARYPDTPLALEGTYLIGHAYREAAKKPQERSRHATVQTVRVASRKQVRHLLDKALHYYSRVQTLLLGREERQELTTIETAMLRNCFLARGSILYDLARYDEAIEVYSNAATRYQNEPIALDTFLQISNCYRRQHKLAEARGAIEQAKVVLKQLPADGDYTTTTNFTRAEWVALLDRLSA